MERPDTLRRLHQAELPVLVHLAARWPLEEGELARCLAVGEGWLAEGRTGPESAALLLPFAADAAPAQALRRFTRAENTRGGWVVVLGPMGGANLRACAARRCAGRPGKPGCCCRGRGDCLPRLPSALHCGRQARCAACPGPGCAMAARWPAAPAVRWPCR